MSVEDASVHSEAPVPVSHDEEPGFPARARVLIVDDIAENRMLLGMFCGQFGLAYECAEGGREAVEAARSGRFDVVLMDIFMPGMDGMAAARAIRALPGPSPTAPVIVAVTTAAGPNEVQRYLACGFSDVVPKPIRIDRLKEALAAAFAQAGRARRQVRRRAAEARRLSA